MMDNKNKTNVIISNILRLGSFISIAFMMIGLVLFAFTTHNISDIRLIKDISLSEAVRGLAVFEPIAFMTIGVVTLLLTPILRVVTAIFTFLLIENDKKHAFISLGVLIILMISMAIPSMK